MKNKIYFLTIIFLVFITKVYSFENKIIFKINNEIITNIDITNEGKYLEVLNKNFSDLPKNKILSISRNSLIKEKIKKIEIEKNFNLDDINEKNFFQIIENLYNTLGINNIEDFKKYLVARDLDYNDVINKIKIENAWNQLIYNKFNSKIKIDINQIKNDILKNKKIKVRKYLLSELVFNSKNKEDLIKKTEVITKDIKSNGFDKAVYEHSISDTSKKGGLLDWIEENSLNNKIAKELNKIDIGGITKPLIIPGGFIILKIEDLKEQEVDRSINLKDEIKKIVRFKTNDQLNQYSKIYFEKVKKDININEL